MLSVAIDWMLENGTTRVELGIQSLDDEVLRDVHRGHSVSSGFAQVNVAETLV